MMIDRTGCLLIIGTAIFVAFVAYCIANTVSGWFA